MAIAIGADGVLGELIDPLGGRQDLRQRIIRAAGPEALRNDPLRVIRAVRFSTELGFEIDAATRQLMSAAAAGVAAVAAERVLRELFLTLRQPDCALLVRVLDDAGALEAIFPEIAAMRGCSQNEHHHADVWTHSLEALESLEGILSSLTDRLGPVAARVRANLDQDNRLPVLKLAMLLHDAGKPETRSVATDTGRVIFYGHDAAGARIAERIAARLKFSVRDRELFVRLVGDHMRVNALAGRDVRQGTLLRWFRRLGEDMVLLILQSMADAAATRGPASPEAEREHRTGWGRATIHSYYAEIKERLDRKPLIGGRDLMAIGIAPGPAMGAILATVRSAQDEGAVQNRDEALALAADLNRRQG
jgi:tRNA nucleotidyltransferase/poly(A) polymerase